MKLQKNQHMLIVIFVDILFLVFSLYFSLLTRHFFDDTLIGVKQLFLEQVFYFIPLFILIISILYISLAYADTTLAYLRKSIPKLAESLSIAFVLGIAYFYIFASYLAISPKVTYLLFFAISFIVLSLSRVLYVKLPLLGAYINAIVLIKRGSIYENVIESVKIHVPRAKFIYVENINIVNIIDALSINMATTIVYDNTDREIIEIISTLPTNVIRNTFVLSGDSLYENVFGKIFLPTFTEESLLREYLNQKPFFEVVKRMFDLFIAIPLFIITIPFIIVGAVAMFLETGRPIFIFQERLGLGRRKMRIPKLRTMSRGHDNGVWTNEGDNKITPIGAVLRKSRIDEFPQLWSVIKGEMSLIGPRPDMTGLEARLREEIDFYHVRYTVPPGLSGWAQVTQEVVPQSVEETRERFAHDMYYIKYRSFFLDFSIALKTVRILLSRLGH